MVVGISWKIGKSLSKNFISINNESIVNYLNISTNQINDPRVIRILANIQLGVKVTITGATTL